MQKASADQHRRALRRLGRLEQKRRRGLPPEERQRRLRLGELRRIVADRYGATLPDDDAGRADLREILNVVALGHGDIITAMMAVGAELAPWLPPDEAERLARSIAAMPRHWLMAKADNIGKRMRLSYADRERMNIHTIGSFDVDKAARAELRRKRDRQRKLEQRRADGAKPRAEYEANSLSRLKPWEKEKISRRTWERRRNQNRDTA